MGIHKTRKSIRKPRKTNKPRKTKKSRKTTRRRSRKFTGGDLVFTPDNDSLRQAIGEYSLNKNAAIARYGKMQDWNTVNVTNTSKIFSAYTFNNVDDLVENWDVSNVTDMSFMFSGIISNFNQPLSRWDVSSVVKMNNMFSNCKNFNQPLNGWTHFSNVRDMSDMFENCYAFNQPLNNLDVSNVRDMSNMFYNCRKFNQSLNEWQVSNVREMSGMFENCHEFNQPLNNWNVSNVTTMSYMFYRCHKFNQPLNNWNVLNVRDMSGMFEDCRKFNQPLDNWNVSNVTTMSNMFYLCNQFNQPLDNWDVSNVTDMSNMFNHCLSYVVLPTWYQAPQPSQLLPELFQYASVEPEQIDKKNTIDITGKTVFDFIMYEDVPITEYLQENSDAIVFYYLGKFYAVKKGELEKAVIDKSFVKYVCPVTGSMRDIVKTVPYLYGRALGIECGLIKLSQIKQIIQSNDIKFVEIVKTDEYAKSTASLSMLLPGANAVGASHCQEGQDAPIVKLYTFEPTNIPPVEPPF